MKTKTFLLALITLSGCVYPPIQGVVKIVKKEKGGCVCFINMYDNEGHENTNSSGWYVCPDTTKPNDIVTLNFERP